MPKKIYNVRLTKKGRRYLKYYVKQGKKSARSITRARILLLADEQKRDEEITAVLGVSRSAVYQTRKRYKEKGLEAALQEKPRSGAPIKIDSRVEAALTMIACSDSPEGTVRWTLRMLAAKLVELKAVDSISPETVRTTLKKTNLNPG